MSKKISQERFVNILMGIMRAIEQFTIEVFNKNFDYKGDEKKLQYEAMIFSLWIITFITPPKNYEIKNMLHSAFSQKYWGVKKNEPLFKQIDKRYKNYYEAFNMWQKNPQSGHMIGTVIVETIRNQNPDFSLSKKIPLVGDTEALKAFMLFQTVFEFSMEAIKEIKKRYKIENLKNF